MMIAFSMLSVLQVRLPAGDDQRSVVHLVVSIRDQLDCTTEYNLSSVIVTPDSVGINDLINNIQSSSNEITNNPIVQLLASGNQNIVGQVITSLSQQFNKMNSESLDKAVSSKFHLIMHYSNDYLSFRWHSRSQYICLTTRKSKSKRGNSII